MTSERNAGLRGILTHASVYKLFQEAVGAKSFRMWLIDHHWKVEPGMTVVDVGCGPARLRGDLPENLDYYGFDPSEDYISSARASAKGTFHVGTINSFLGIHGERLQGNVDRVICSAVLHHLSLEQIHEVLAGAKWLLNASGRFSAMEPCFSAKQSLLSRWVVRQDRGTNVMHEHEWLALIKTVFMTCRVDVVHGMLRIPYTHALITAS